jgi:hypothetical protein
MNIKPKNKIVAPIKICIVVVIGSSLLVFAEVHACLAAWADFGLFVTWCPFVLAFLTFHKNKNSSSSI